MMGRMGRVLVSKDLRMGHAWDTMGHKFDFMGHGFRKIKSRAESLRIGELKKRFAVFFCCLAKNFVLGKTNSVITPVA